MRVGRRHLIAKNVCASAGKGYVVDIETGFLYTCNKTCKMNVSAVCAASQNPKIVSTQPTKASGSPAMFATAERGCEVVPTNEKRGIGTPCDVSVQ